MALDPITAVLDIGGKVIDKIWPNKADADAAKIRLFELQQQGQLAVIAEETKRLLAQVETNTAEASNPSLLVSGWRPAIGWVCAASFAWSFVVGPALVFSFAAAGKTVALPMLDMDQLMTVLVGMLGLGLYRTVEKVKGVA